MLAELFAALAIPGGRGKPFMRPGSESKTLQCNEGRTGLLRAAPASPFCLKKLSVHTSSASIDLRDKRRAYCRNGVREYLVWLEEDDYCPQLPDAQGVLHSRVFPDLQLPVAPLLDGDTAKVLATLTVPEPL